MNEIQLEKHDFLYNYHRNLYERFTELFQLELKKIKLLSETCLDFPENNGPILLYLS